MNRLPGTSQNPYPLEYGNSPTKKAKTDQEKQPKSPIDIQLEQVTNTFNVAVTLMGLNRKRYNSVVALLPRDVCRYIVKMTFPSHLKPASKTITAEEFSKLISKTPLLKSVDLRKYRYIKAESVIALAKRSPGLESIKCRVVSDDAVTALAKHCPRLKHIHIENSLLTEKSLQTLGRLRELTSLYLRLDVNKDDDLYFEALSTLIQQLPNLEKFKGGANNDVLIALANNCKGLTHLETLESAAVGEENCVTDDAFKTFARQCPNIRSITLNGLTVITNETLSALAWNCHNLQSVKLYSCDHISDRGVVELTEQCKHLKKLDVSGEFDPPKEITVETVYAVNKNLVNLRHFGIDYYDITDEVMIAFAERHPEVTKLSLNGTLITDATIIALATHCHKLVEVNLGATDITEKGVEALIENCPHLKKCFIFGMDMEKWHPSLEAKYPNIKFD